MVDSLSVIIVFKLAQIERAHITECRNPLISPTTTGVPSPKDWHLLVWVNQANFAHGFENATFDCVLYVLLNNKPLVVHPQI